MNVRLWWVLLVAACGAPAVPTPTAPPPATEVPAVAPPPSVPSAGSPVELAETPVPSGPTPVAAAATPRETAEPDLPPAAPPPEATTYEAASRRAEAAFTAGLRGEALVYSLEAVRLQPASLEGHVRLVLAHYRLDQLDAALEALTAARPYARTPRETARLDALGSVIRDKRTFLDHLGFAELATEAGRQAEAAEALTNAWRSFPARFDVAGRAMIAWNAAGSCGRAYTIAAFLARSGEPEGLRTLAASQVTALARCAAQAAPSDRRVDFFACPPGGLLRNGRCDCSTLAPVFDRSGATPRCTPCPGSRTWNGASCVCPAGTTERGGECACPPEAPIWSEQARGCRTCGRDRAWDAATCRCPAETHWNGSECECFDPTPVWSAAARRCVGREGCERGAACACPGGQAWDGARCACPRDLPVWTGYGCEPRRP